MHLAWDTWLGQHLADTLGRGHFYWRLTHTWLGLLTPTLQQVY
jgi:hypothetical protein